LMQHESMPQTERVVVTRLFIHNKLFKDKPFSHLFVCKKSHLRVESRN
jgi:hypothetical protein